MATFANENHKKRKDMKKTFMMLITACLVVGSCGTYEGTGAYTGAQFGHVLGSAVGGIAGGWRGHEIGSLVGTIGGAVAGAPMVAVWGCSA